MRYRVSYKNQSLIDVCDANCGLPVITILIIVILCNLNTTTGDTGCALGTNEDLDAFPLQVLPHK